MHSRIIGIVSLIAAVTCLPDATALAASVGSDIVYEKVDTFSNSVQFTDNFTIGVKGTYKATLTDFQFPDAFTASGLDVTTGIASLGRIDGPGSFTFDAGPGDYYVGMFASVGGVSAEQKDTLIKADLKKRAQERWGDLTQEEKQKRRELRKSRSDEEKEKARQKAWMRAERRVDAQLASLGASGQYGVQIALLPTDGGYSGGGIGAATAVVPVPGALWLFGTGLAAFLGFGCRCASHA